MANGESKERIKLSELKSIILYKDNYTNSKRNSPSLQVISKF